MKKSFLILTSALVALTISGKNVFPDGTPIGKWFEPTPSPELSQMGKVYRVTDYGVVSTDSTLLQTEKLQAIIDRAAREGGGVVVIPRGVFLSSALFFKPGTKLYLEEGATLKAIDDIGEYPVVETRMEGQTLKYFPALVNADHVDGFTIAGKGTLDGNGLRYWKSFWKRCLYNKKCTNMDELRPRVIYVSNSNHVTIDGIRVKNSPYWSTHYYKCDSLHLQRLHITSPVRPVPAPSTDAIDLDVCSYVYIGDCYMSVNDDAVALKGGKGPWADRDKNNGKNENILIENCVFGPNCHSTLTCGSEAIHNRNILLRDSKVENPWRLLFLKMRPDTPQNYEYVMVENVTGKVKTLLRVMPWTQFYDLKGRKDLPVSTSSNITLKDLSIECKNFVEMRKSDKYRLRAFTFENLDIQAEKSHVDTTIVEGWKFINVKVNGRKL
jgi:polygalacturonase